MCKREALSRAVLYRDAFRLGGLEDSPGLSALPASVPVQRLLCVAARLSQNCMTMTLWGDRLHEVCKQVLYQRREAQGE